MLEVLIIAAVITAKLFGVDRQYAKRGQTPPGYRLIERWLDGRKARGQAAAGAKPAKYGMWRYVWQRWCALWEVLAKDHEIRHQQYLKARAEALAAGKTPPARPTLKQQAVAAWQWLVDHVITPPKDKTPDKPVPPEPESTDGPRIACDRCGATLVDVDGGRQHPAGSDCPAAQPTDPVPAVTDTTSPAAPAAPAPALSKGETMTAPTTQQSGEVTGLMSAINYAGAVAAAHEAHSLGGGEQYRAALGQAQVGPETLQSAGAAQEASEIAGAAWRAHEAKLREQLAAKEATTAETGSREFLLAE